MKLLSESALGANLGTKGVIFPERSNVAGLIERADVGCLLINSAVGVADVIQSASVESGVQLPAKAGAISTSGTRLALWLSPRSWLVQCSLAEENDIASRLNAAFPDRRLHASLFTDYLCWLDLRGKQSLDLLREGSFISLDRGGLSVGHAKRTLIAGIGAIVIRRKESVWRIGIERSRARYLADWLTTTRAAMLSLR